jgi:hypothetical protein
VKLYVADTKGVIAPWRVRRREKGEIKNEGISHDVIENKCRKISVLGYPTMSMKTKGLFCYSHDVYEKKCT